MRKLTEEEKINSDIIRKLYKKEYNKKWCELNPNYNKIYTENNLDNVKENQEKWRKKNKPKIKELSKEYRKNNPEKVKKLKNTLTKKRKNNDPSYKLICNIRTAIGSSLRRMKYTKKSKSYQILGCSFEEFKQHIESLWEPWMNWNNYGNPKDGIIVPNKTWDVDHIIPVSTAKTEDDVIKLNHYSNLQPLCSYHNRYIKRCN